jgi:hypothetical protein
MIFLYLIFYVSLSQTMSTPTKHTHSGVAQSGFKKNSLIYVSSGDDSDVVSRAPTVQRSAREKAFKWQKTSEDAKDRTLMAFTCLYEHS